MITLDAVSKALIDNDNFFITIHDNADADCLGSALALCKALSNMGKSAQILSPSDIPERLKFLTDKNTSIHCGYENVKQAINDSSFIMSVDVASEQLFGSIKELVVPKLSLAIDHHNINTLSTEQKYVDSKASAAGEIIFSLIGFLETISSKSLFDSFICNSLYAAISSDTGCFKYSNVTPITHVAAASLIERGAFHADINYRLFDIKTKMQIAVEKTAYELMRFFYNDALAIVYISDEKLSQIGAMHEDTECVSQLARMVKGVQIGVYMYEKSPGIFKFSVRSNNSKSMSKLCSLFGGGGHEKAAGCTIEGTWESTLNDFVSAAKDFLE